MARCLPCYRIFLWLESVVDIFELQDFTHRPFFDTQAFFEHALEAG